ncbi:hypothetical protein ANN_23286 [Periplaneta americana]|uniref:Uncharacterized protein n=1 Tax=Periplaneta americana TaxID=6978 RepID=A0ABQ8SL44_PERAM|nr:hypothetical protein ANN_23286 [Periplaneta americana]
MKDVIRENRYYDDEQVIGDIKTWLRGRPAELYRDGIQALISSFMKRHQKLSVRQPEAASLARAKGFCKENVFKFSDLYERIVDDNQLQGTRIYNVDESGFTTVQRGMKKIVGQKAKKLNMTRKYKQPLFSSEPSTSKTIKSKKMKSADSGRQSQSAEADTSTSKWADNRQATNFECTLTPCDLNCGFLLANSDVDYANQDFRMRNVHLVAVALAEMDTVVRFTYGFNLNYLHAVAAAGSGN